MVLLVTTLIPRRPADVAGADRLAADLLEIRLDGLAAEDVAATVGAVELPVIASCRRTEDGGLQRLDDEQRLARLRAALEAGAAMIDVEQDASFRADLVRDVLTAGGDPIISHHDLDATPSKNACLQHLRDCQEHATVIKLATHVQDPGDVQTLFEAALDAPTLGTPFALMGVGDAALRAAAGPLGMALVYTAPGSASVPGQLPVKLQRALPRAPPPPEGFHDYVLLGEHIGHSLSPRMQNAAFAHLGEPARYRPIEVPADRVELAVAGLRAMGVVGGNVTSPHKGTLFHLCDEVTAIAEQAQAVNTFRFDGESIAGHITDGLGVIQALHARGESVHGRRVVVVGAGGTARSAAHAFAQANADLVCVNRTAKRAEAIAADVGARVAALDQNALRDALTEDAILFNATPVDLPLDEEVLRRVSVFDATYGPGRAALARRAALAGTRALDGLDLLVHQGDLALRFWLDTAADDALLGVLSCAARTGALEQRYAREAA